ncbi:MAG TPA: S41 family peptidase [Bryobacteraceae bacterium]|jgi:carboxyl-terminal processing protease|nr:S41 family peptidase [Bryobacteraceae bacterium]
MNTRAKFLVVVSSTFLVLLLLLGTVLGKGTSPDNPYRHLAVYTEVLSRIKSEYVEEPDLKSVTLGALNGLLESIDPFASYLNADQYKEYLKHSDAKGDVGLILSKRFGYIGVVAAVPGSPAAKAGLTTGDIIETINKVATRDMPLAYTNLLLRGNPGTSVDVTVLRRQPEPQKMTLVRAVLNPPPVTSKILPDDVGYIRPETLSAARVQEVATDLRDLQTKGAKRLVLDLRQCAVGEPEDGVALADLFLDSGVVTYLQGQRVPRQDFKADASKVIWKLPVVVLTNRGTADAAEVASAALEDNNRAKVVGERTYGDASLRRALTMDDGSAIILSVAKYYSPSGKAIQDVGVTPGEVVQEPEPQVETDEDGEVVRPDPNQPEHKPGEDVILKRGIELLSK